MWDLVGNPEDRFSHNEAHFVTSIPDEKMMLKNIPVNHSTIPDVSTCVEDVSVSSKHYKSKTSGTLVFRLHNVWKTDF